jgi:Uncharacterized protein conserved in bacteria (DUF2252)
MTVDVVAFTDEYETWLGAQIPVLPDDLRAKHEELAGPVLRFLRGTYYLWLRRVADLVPQLLDRPAVPLVGDLHIENFGTWRDRHGVRRWGVNDLDELARGPYPLDLLRLATSAVLTPHVPLSPAHICRLLLEHWQAARPGPAVDIDTARHLHALTPVAGHGYFAGLQNGPAADPAGLPAAVRSAVLHSVASGWRPEWHARRAGTGSLGHPRLVAIGRDARDEWQAREVKLLGPPTVMWPPASVGPAVDRSLYPAVTAALPGPHPGGRVHGWQLRRLAPDVVRIELSGLAVHDAERVLRSMAQAVVDVHGVDGGALAAARADAAGLGGDWLPDAVATMAADTEACHRQWCRFCPARDRARLVKIKEAVMDEQPRTGEPVIRTGADQPWDPEDLTVAKGQDPTPANVERNRRELDEDGPAAIEKTVP